MEERRDRNTMQGDRYQTVNLCITQGGGRATAATHIPTQRWCEHRPIQSQSNPITVHRLWPKRLGPGIYSNIYVCVHVLRSHCPPHSCLLVDMFVRSMHKNYLVYAYNLLSLILKVMLSLTCI